MSDTMSVAVSSDVSASNTMSEGTMSGSSSSDLSISNTVSDGTMSNSSDFSYNSAMSLSTLSSDEMQKSQVAESHQK
jgi:hypothetical protein